jgi:deoxyribodipyrimidine photo-lyase
MTASDEIALVWFRRDLRLDDNPAWAAATSERKYIVPLYVIEPRLLDSVGPFRRRQLVANLQALDYELAEGAGDGGRLLVRFGDPRELVPEAVDVLGAGHLYFNADVSAFAVKRDQAVIKQVSVPVHQSHGSLVLPPGSVLTKKGSVSRVFTSFFKVWQQTPWDAWPEPGEPGAFTVYDDPGEFVPQLDAPPPLFEGPREAQRRLDAWLEQVDRYDSTRDRPDQSGTSKLSADLRFGTLSPRAVATAVGDGSAGRKAFVRQLAWRDWFSHLMYENPSLPTRAMQERFDRIQWRNDPGDVARWKGGFTGYPIVDAGMRELRQTGFMHNRVRMVTGSFLVKDLLVDWRIGEAHFRHLLTDFDVASNVGNWQWVAGAGPDAQPFFRVFNPVSQSRQHDPEGTYIRRWVPELAALDTANLHAPWEAPAEALQEAGIVLGREYPEPIVSHTEARERALAVYKAAEKRRDDVPTEDATT